MEDLFQEGAAPPSTQIEWGGERTDVPATSEQISISLLQAGHKVDAPMLDTHKIVKEQVNVGDESVVEQASTETWKQKVDRRRQEMLSKSEVDLKEMHEGEVLIDGIWSPLEHKITATQDTLTTKLFNQTASESPEEFDRLTHLLEASDEEFRYRQAINDGFRMLSKMDDELSLGETIGDVVLSVFEPFAEVGTFINVIDEAAPAANLSGIGIPTERADALVKHIVGLPKDEGIEVINNMIGSIYQRQNQLGVAENKLTNLMVGSILMNYLTEDRSTEEGAGFLGMQNVSDFGLNVVVGLEALNAAQLAEFTGMLVARAFRKPKPYKDFVNPDEAWRTKLLENKKPETKVEEAKDIIPEHTMSKDTGSALDIRETISKGSIKKMSDDIPPERLPEAFEALGSSMESVSARLRPNSTGSISNSLPPSALDPNLSRLWESTTGKSHTTMMGFKGDRTIAQAKFAQEFLSVTVGANHPARGFWTPPAEGDSLSTGTFHVRLGATPDTGFTDIVAAEQLLDTYRRKGISSKIILGDNEMFVELQSTQVMQRAAAGKFGSDGLPLVSPISSMLIPPSERMVGITDSMSPQRILSYAIDAGQGIKQGLMTAAEPFLKVAKQLTGTDSDFVMQAVLQGEREERVFTREQLLDTFPEMVGREDAINAYYSYRSTMDGIAMIRSMQKRVKLHEAGMKQILVGDTQFYGKVIADVPTVKLPNIGEDGVLIPEKVDSDAVFTGTAVFDPIANAPLNISQDILDEIYKKGGRLIKMSQPQEVDGAEFNYSVVRSMNDLAIEELPIYPDFGLVGFASERMYADPGALVVRLGVEKTVDGVKSLGIQVMGIAKTRGEAKGISSYFQQQHPNDTFAIQDSREVRSLINGGGSGTPQQPFMMKRGEHVAGKIQNGEPTRAEILDIGESLQRSIHSSSTFPSELAEVQIEGRWMNQYGKFLREELKGAFPRAYDKDMFNIRAIEDAGLDVPNLRKDSELLHHLAANMRAHRVGKLEAKVRSRMAAWAKAAGEPEHIVAALASRAITRVAKVSPQQIARGTTGTLQIALAITFQPIQNILNSLTLMGIQGEEGVRAIADASNLIYASQQLKNGADFDAALLRIQNSVGVDRGLAEQFVKKWYGSGIQGSAGEVDNVLRHVTEAIHVGVGRSTGAIASRAATAVPRGIIDAGKKIVSGSIDFTMYGFWSLSFRKALKDYRGNGKVSQIGDDDFWEIVRQGTRSMSQNQNGSDLLSFEEKGSALAFMFQFQQHIQKQALQGGKLAAKALGAKVESPFAKTQADAAKAWGSYLVLAGAGGAGGLVGIQAMQELLPDEIASPKSRVNKLINAFAMGGLIDLSVNGLWDMIEGFDPDSQNVIASGQVLGGAGADIVARYARLVTELVDTGKIDMDVIEGLGGAAAGTFSQTLNMFRIIPTTMSSEGLDTPEQLMESFKLLSQITKGGRDIFAGLNMLELEKRVGTQSGKLSGTSTTKTAILKMFGFNSTAHVLEQGYTSTIFAQREREDAIVDSTLKHLRLLRTNIIKPDVPESYEKYQVLQEDVMKAVGLSLSDSQKDRVRKKIFTETLKGLHGDETFKHLEMMSKYNHDVPTMIKRFSRMPDVSAEMLEQLQIVLSVINEQEEE